PSGDQKGATGKPVVKKPSAKLLMLVNAVRPLPSAFTTQTFCAPLVLAASLPSRARCDAKATLVPSGDQTGGPKLLAAIAVSLVKAVGMEPSAFTTQMLEVELILAALLPSSLRDETKAILVPSGDHTGVKLWAFGAVSLVKAVGLVPSAFTTQM